MDENEDTTPTVSSDEAEMKVLLGLFDMPAFSRRGADLEFGLTRLNKRLARERLEMMDMVRVRLKQWAGVATGPDDFADVFLAPVATLYELAGAERPIWAQTPAPERKRRSVARDLTASVARFEKRWLQFLDALRLDPLNHQIDQYNRYYVLEKECVIGSARLAARHFVPKPRLSRDSLLAEHPTLPLPQLAG